MPQGFTPGYPPTSAPIASLPLRTNLDAVFSGNSGTSAPAAPSQGTPWIDTNDANNVKFKLYIAGAWRTVIEYLQLNIASIFTDEMFVYAPVNAGQISGKQFTLTESINFINNDLGRVAVFINGMRQPPITGYYSSNYITKVVTLGVEITLDSDDIVVFIVKKLIGVVYDKTTP